MRALCQPTSLLLAIAVASAVVPTLCNAQTTPGVDRLSPLDINQSDVNAAGANVYQRMALDNALSEAAKKLGPRIRQQCGTARPVLVLEGTAQGIPSILTARAAQMSALLDLDRINKDIKNVTDKLNDFARPQASGQYETYAVPAAAGIAPAIIDLVRVVDSIRFITSLTRTSYAFTAASGVAPTPGLTEQAFLTSLGGAPTGFRLGDPLTSTSKVHNAYQAASASLEELEKASGAASLRATNEDRKKVFEALKKEADTVRLQLTRYITPGDKNAPSPLQQLVAADFVLPETTDCLVSYQPTVDATTITTQRAIFPNRKFDIDSRATILATVYSPARPNSPDRTSAIAHCKETIDPKTRPLQASACEASVLSPAVWPAPRAP